MSATPKLRPAFSALPLDAAIDVFAVSAGPSAALEPHLEADALGLIARIEAEVASDRATQAATKALSEGDEAPATAEERAVTRLLQLLDGLQVRAVRRGFSEATVRGLAVAFERLAPLPVAAVVTLCRLVFDGPAQLAVVGVGPLLFHARLGPEAASAVYEAATPFAQRDTAAWREYAVHPGADALCTRLCERALNDGDLAAARSLGLAWPPGGATLTTLCLALAAAHDLRALGRLLGRFSREGMTARGCGEALWADAVRRGDDSLAAWLAERAPGPESLRRCREATPPALWPTRRDALLEAWIAGGSAGGLGGEATRECLADRSGGDGLWLVDALAEGEDAVSALDALCGLASARPKLQARAAAALRARDPQRAFRRDCQRLRDALRAGHGGLDRLEVKRLRQELEASARALGEPGLATGVLDLLRRELGVTIAP